MKTSLKQPDYRRYEFQKGEWAGVILLAFGVVCFLAAFFYRSPVAVIPLAPLAYPVIRYVSTGRGEKRRRELNEQFKECILSVSASLQAGYAVENAFLESREDMRLLYGESSMIFGELEIIRRGLVINIPLEEMLSDLGERSGSEEIYRFAQMFAIAKRGGGSLPEMIRTSANLISEKLEARNEITTILTGRKMEQNIMRVMPFGILLYVGSTNPGYFDPLYHNLTGVAVMTVCLGIYLCAILIGEKVFEKIRQQMDGKVKLSTIPAMQRNGILGRTAVLGEVVFTWLDQRIPAGEGREKLRKNLEILCPEEPRGELVRKYYGGKIGMSVLVLLAGMILGGCVLIRGQGEQDAENPGGILLGLSVAASAGIFFLMDKDLADQVKKRKEALQLAYPDLVHRLALLLVAGLTIRGAFEKLGKDNELAKYTNHEIQTGQSEQAAYEHFGKRAGVREYVKLSTLLCQNLKKGNSTLLARLEEEAVIAAESRIQSGKKLGEEAGTKLLVPMVMLLGVVMVMIMVPAFSVMGM